MPPATSVFVLPSLLASGSLAGSQAVIIDLLRASTTICAALQSGASSVRPVLEPDEAFAMRDRLAQRVCVLGGERAGVLIPGFDLGNSPREYTAERVRGREVVFTTTNGTRAIHAASDAGASRVLIGCFANLSAAVDSLVSDGRDAHLVCAGTNGRVSMEDVLCAGAFAARLCARGFVHGSDDQSRIAQRLYESAAAAPHGVLNAMLESLGGRNLVDIGMREDVIGCSQVDSMPIVPIFDAAAGTLTQVA